MAATTKEDPMLRTRFGLAMATAVLGTAGVLSLAACGPADGLANLSPEGQVLAAMGYAPADLQAETTTVPASDPSPGASAGARTGDGKHRAAARVLLRKNLLHGEATVQTKEGTKVVDVQRGTVTAIDDKSVTVKSSDGFVQTWAIGTPIHVVQHRTAAQLSAVTVGAEVGIAGVKEGGTVTARLIVIPDKK
jgi:hypothetical protein